MTAADPIECVCERSSLRFTLKVADGTCNVSIENAGMAGEKFAFPLHAGELAMCMLVGLDDALLNFFLPRIAQQSLKLRINSKARKFFLGVVRAQFPKTSDPCAKAFKRRETRLCARHGEPILAASINPEYGSYAVSQHRQRLAQIRAMPTPLLP